MSALVLFLLWIVTALLNIVIMMLADDIHDKKNPGEGYWILNKIPEGILMSFLGGPICLPFTFMALYDCFKNR